jgi:hypothetical protein
MFWFTLKKWFFDFWDNLFFALILNIVFDLFLAVPTLLGALGLNISHLAGSSIFVVGVLLIFLFLAVANGFTLRITTNQRLTLSAIPEIFRRGGAQGFIFGALQILLFWLTQIAARFYGGLNQPIGIVFMLLIFWLVVFWLLIGQYFFPVSAQLDTKLSKIFRKSVIIFMDNPTFTLLVALVSLVIMALSFLTMSLFPGITGLLLWHQTAVKLRLYKYDYLEQHPDATNKDIPWDLLIKKDRDILGPRTIRGLIFPWKH